MEKNSYFFHTPAIEMYLPGHEMELFSYSIEHFDDIRRNRLTPSTEGFGTALLIGAIVAFYAWLIKKIYDIFKKDKESANETKEKIEKLRDNLKDTENMLRDHRKKDEELKKSLNHMKKEIDRKKEENPDAIVIGNYSKELLNKVINDSDHVGILLEPKNVRALFGVNADRIKSAKDILNVVNEYEKNIRLMIDLPKHFNKVVDVYNNKISKVLNEFKIPTIFKKWSEEELKSSTSIWLEIFKGTKYEHTNNKGTSPENVIEIKKWLVDNLEELFKEDDSFIQSLVAPGTLEVKIENGEPIPTDLSDEMKTKQGNWLPKGIVVSYIEKDERSIGGAKVHMKWHLSESEKSILLDDKLQMSDFKKLLNQLENINKDVLKAEKDLEGFVKKMADVQDNLYRLAKVIIAIYVHEKHLQQSDKPDPYKEVDEPMGKLLKLPNAIKNYVAEIVAESYTKPINATSSWARRLIFVLDNIFDIYVKTYINKK